MLPPHKDVSEPMSSSPDPGSEVTNGGEALLPKEEVPVEKEEESSLEAATTRKPADSAVVLSDALVEDAESQNVPGSSSGGGSPVAVPSPLSEKKGETYGHLQQHLSTHRSVCFLIECSSLILLLLQIPVPP